MNANLAFRPCVVIAAKPPSQEPCIAAGYSADTPVGPAIILGVSCVIPGQGAGLCLLAHLSPDEASGLIPRLMAAVDQARAAMGKGELELSQAAKSAALEAMKGRPDDNGPVVLAVPGRLELAGEPARLNSDAFGIQAQVQWGDGEAPEKRPGIIGFGAQAAPDGRPLLICQVSHADGKELNAILEMEQLPLFMECQEMAASAVRAMRQGAGEEPIQ